MRKVKNHLLIFVGLVGSLWGSLSTLAQADVLKDVVLVPAEKPFYIQIFDMSGTDAQALVPQAESVSWKAARLKSVGIAQQVCGKIGMRLPTRQEWLAAGSDLGKNTKYTLRGDSLYSAENMPLANIHGDESFMPTDIKKLGIDAVGTVGMTGNRAQYFLDPDGSWGTCGGEYGLYGSNSDADFELSRICTDGWGHMRNPTATVRCVKDYDSSIQVELTTSVPGDLKKYIADKAAGVPMPTAATSAPSFEKKATENDSHAGNLVRSIEMSGSTTKVYYENGTAESSHGTSSPGSLSSGSLSADTEVHHHHSYDSSGYPIDSGSSSMSFAHPTLDQFVNVRNRKIRVKQSDGGYSSSGKNAELTLIFPEDEVSLGAGQVLGNEIVWELTTEELTALFNRSGTRVAELEVTQGNRKFYNHEEDRPKVHFGSFEYDTACAHPILISDFHDTLNKRDKCTAPALKRLADLGVTIAINSTLGSSILSELENLKFELKIMQNTIFLPSESENGSFSSGGGASEKAARTIRSLWASNACILGFVGDTPGKEGEASNQLMIPYYSVNQLDETISETVPMVDEHDACVIPKSYAIVKGKHSSDPTKAKEKEVLCPTGYIPEKSDMVVCSRTKTSWLSGEEKQELQYFPAGTDCYSVTSGGTWLYERTDHDVISGNCVTTLPLEKKLEEDGTCVSPYLKQHLIRKYDVKRVLGHKPAFDISAYPQGSKYAHDWCELGPEIEKDLASLRATKESTGATHE